MPIPLPVDPWTMQILVLALIVALACLGGWLIDVIFKAFGR